MTVDAAALLAQLGTNPSGNQTDPVLRALISAVGGIPVASDFNETVQDMIATFLQVGPGLTLTYNDAGNQLTIGIDSAALTETVQDIVGAFILAGANITVTYNDAGNSFTIASTSGGAPDVADEGSVVQAAATKINFVGAGVTVVSDGSGGAIATIPGASGSSPAWVTNHPDTPPTSPTLFGGVNYNLEFVRDNVLAGGTILGAPATAPSIVDRALRVVGGTSASADVKGVEWAAPTAPYTMTAKVRRKLTSGSFGNFGIALRTAGTAHTAIVCNQNGGFTSGQVGWDDYTALTTRSGFGANSNYPIVWPIYLRIVNDGTNLSYQVSTTGQADSFVAIATRTIAAALGATPTKFAVTMDTFGATALTGYCEWIRFT